MSTYEHFDKICCAVLIFTLFLTLSFLNAESFGIEKSSSVLGYENKLFDTSSVHTIDIVMDNWEEFIANCKSEDYHPCAVTIDNEIYKNVAIRAKGNTSLTQVESYGNNRYSFKIEFDHYDGAKSYYGLDKLCLNNLIQDNTYMKDYLTYQMMAQMDVASPLCSYVNITINGENWGLYLAIEGVEESFLQRNYGNDYGELYKPDSMSMGGGRGNGEKFDMDAQMPDDMQGGQMPYGTQDGQMPYAMRNGQMPYAMQGEQMPYGMQGGQMPYTMQNGQMPYAMRDGNRGDRMNGSDDVLLKYIDDEVDSYSNIFDNAKTEVSDNDKIRLIASLKKLSAGETLSDTVDVEAVIRYFVVHNFVLNFDSYTGSMIHNYYLYEKDGQLQMIPWDYNLAFGGFASSGGAINLVNYPIDSPISGGNIEDRPMIAWIFENEDYTELYHRYFAEFIEEWFENSRFEKVIDGVSSMIAPYVEKDTTKYCTYEEFKTGVSSLKEFCILRSESVKGQLDGTIGSAKETQSSDSLIDTGNLQISDMGTMNNAMGGGREKPDNGIGRDSQNPQSSQNPQNSQNPQESQNENMRQMPKGEMQEGIPTERLNKGMPDGIPQENPQENINGQMPYRSGKPDAIGQGNIPPAQPAVSSSSTWLWLAISVILLVLSIIFAIGFKRRRAA